MEKKSGTTTKKILFVSHEASRTGAPIVLLHLMKWLKANTDIPFQILLKRGGELEQEFEALAPVINLSREIEEHTRYVQASKLVKIIRKILYHLNSKMFPQPDIQLVVFDKIRKRLSQENIGIIYSNTITNGDLIDIFINLKCPLITHVHELRYVIDNYVSQDNFRQTKEHSLHYVAAAEVVKENLIVSQDIASNKITVVHAFIPIEMSTGEKKRNDLLRQQLNISQEAIIVGASGTMSWRKGTDLFILLARAVHSRQLDIPIHFIWVGSHSTKTYLAEILYDVKQANLEEYVHFIGAKENPLDYFREFDIFTLVSREDPFPLVVLEAASVGKPIVCFDKAGGAKELVENDCGIVVPYMDVEAMADKVLMLSNSEKLRSKLGQCAAQKVSQRYSAEIASSQIFELIKKFM